VLTTPAAPAETAAALDDLTQPCPELLAVACRLADEVGQAFGIAEMGHLSPTGEVRQRYWGHDFQPLMVTWAQKNGLTVTDDVIQSD
jgi:hypothetical protein